MYWILLFLGGEGCEYRNSTRKHRNDLEFENYLRTLGDALGSLRHAADIEPKMHHAGATSITPTTTAAYQVKLCECLFRHH